MTVYFRGTTNAEYVQMGGATVSTASGHFRSAMVPCCLNVTGGSNTQFHESIKDHSADTFWHSFRVFSVFSAQNSGGAKVIVWLDADLVERIRIVTAGNGLYKVEKVDAALSATQLGSTFRWFPSITTNVIDKIDVYIDNAASGRVIIYINLIKVFDYSGDTTTDSVTTISKHWLGNTGFSPLEWSEVMITDFDTRSKNLNLLAPVANGTTHSFDTGSPAAANVNTVSVDDSTLDGSRVAAQIDGYTVPNLASGTYAVLNFALSLRSQKGSSGPTKLAGGLRIGGTNYFDSDLPQDIAWDNYQPDWDVSPATSAPFLVSEINAAGFNIMARSAA